MRTYHYDAGWNEFQNGGPGEPETKTRNILSGLGWAVIPIPSYEGASLATWKTRHFDKIRVMDNTATRTLWEGYVDQVKPTRTGLDLFCLEPQAMLQRILAKAWADYELDEGIITDIPGGGTQLIDAGQDFATDEWNTKGLLITGLAPHFALLRTDFSDIVGGFVGAPPVIVQDEPDAWTSYDRTVGADDTDYWQFYGDPTDLGSLKVDYQLKIDWTGTNPNATLQIYNNNTPGWENIVSSFTDNTIERGTHTISSNLDYYVDSDDQVLIRRHTAGAEGAVDYTWTVYQCKVYGIWSNEFDGTSFVVDDTTAPDTLTIASGSLVSAYAHVGDKYMIGERLDVMLAAIFSNETTKFDGTDIDTSTQYMYRTFENGPCLEIVRACQDVDRAEYWNDVSAVGGFTFKYATSFDASGFEVNETNIDTNGIEGGYAAEHVIEKVTVFGDPETGIQSTYTAGSYTAGDPERTFWQRFKKTLTECYQMAKGIVDARAGTAPFVGGFRFTKDLTALQSLTVGQTVDLKIDMNANASDDIDEDNSLVRVIDRSEAPNGRLNTRIEVGPAPLHVNEFHGKPSDLPKFDRGYELKRSMWEDAQKTRDRTTSKVPSASPHGPHGGQRTAPLDFDDTYHDLFIRLAGVDKFTADTTDIDLGTSTINEDANVWGDVVGGPTAGLYLDQIVIEDDDITADVDIFFVSGEGDQFYFDSETDISGTLDASEDVDAGDDVLFGTSVFVLEDDGTGNAKITATDGLQVEATGGDPYLVLAEDSTNFAIIQFDDTADIVTYKVYDDSVLSDHQFFGDIIQTDGDFKPSGTGGDGNVGTSTYYFNTMYADTYYGKTGTIQSFDSLDDIAIMKTHFVEKDGMIDPETIPDFLKDETGEFTNQKALFGFLIGTIKQLIQHIEEKVDEKTKDPT